MANDSRRYKWEHKSWTGGLAFDRFIGRPNTFQYSANIDTQSLARGLCLAPSPYYYDELTEVPFVADTADNDFGTSDDSSTVSIITVGDYIVLFKDEGKIFSKEWDDTIRIMAGGTWDTVDITGHNIRGDAVLYNDNIYYNDLTKLYNANASAITDGDPYVENDIGEFSSTSANHPQRRPMVELGNKLYIGDGRYLAEVDDTLGSPIFTAEKLKLPQCDSIVAITYNGSAMRIYTVPEEGSEQHRALSKCYVWDGVSDSYSSVMYFNTGLIIDVEPYLGNDAVLISNSNDGANMRIYVTDGYSSSLLIETLPEGGDSSKYNVLAASGEYIYYMSEYGVVRIGRKTNDLPFSASIIVSNTDGNEDMDTEFTRAGGTRPYIAAFGSIIMFTHFYPLEDFEYVRMVDLSVTTSSLLARRAFLVSRIFTGNNVTKKKRLRGIDIAYDIPTVDSKIRIYLRKNFHKWNESIHDHNYRRLADPYEGNTAYDFTLIKELDSTTAQPVIHLTDNDLTAGFNEFYTLELKIEIGTDSLNENSYYNNPTLFEVIVHYDHIQ